MYANCYTYNFIYHKNNIKLKLALFIYFFKAFTSGDFDKIFLALQQGANVNHQVRYYSFLVYLFKCTYVYYIVYYRNILN